MATIMHKTSFKSVTDPGFLKGDTDLEATTRAIFPKNCMKMKKFWPVGACVTPAPRSATVNSTTDKKWHRPMRSTGDSGHFWRCHSHNNSTS